MVRVVNKEGKRLHRCEECGFHYPDEETAKKCEAWCKKYKGCSIEITKLAVENQ